MEYSTTFGVDVSDRNSKICVMAKSSGGERRIVIETTCATTKAGFEIVANPSLVPSITKSNKKNDRNDARELARLAIADPAMLHPVFLRDEVYQQMLRFHHARNMLVSQRTQTINQIRGFAKSLGHRIECSSSERFHELSRSDWPKELEEAVWPLMANIKETDLKLKMSRPR